jgi:hypothetical protein
MLGDAALELEIAIPQRRYVGPGRQRFSVRNDFRASRLSIRAVTHTAPNPNGLSCLPALGPFLLPSRGQFEPVDPLKTHGATAGQR